MNVIGVLVHVQPSEEIAVGHALGLMPGVDVHAATSDGRLVVTAHDVDGRNASDSLMAMALIPGVINAALVYHAFEPEPPAEPDFAAAPTCACGGGCGGSDASHH